MCKIVIAKSYYFWIALVCLSYVFPHPVAILLLKLMYVVSLRFPSNAVSFFLIDRVEFNYSRFVMWCNKNVLLWAWEWSFGLFVLRGQLVF